MRKRHCSNIKMAGLVVLLMLGLYIRAALDGADIEATYVSDNAATRESSMATRVSTAGKAGTSDPPEKKKIALTFDDGPNPEYTMMLLSGLKERGVKATFFLLGKEVERYPDIVAEMYADGHLIGTHAYEHVNLGNLSDAEAVAQVNRTNAAISEVTGVSAEFIRPPFGSWKANLDYETKMIEVLWDIDPLDWKTDNSDVIASRVIEKVQENDIILLHDASESSVNAAFKIIDALTAEGYIFVTVDEIILE